MGYVAPSNERSRVSTKNLRNKMCGSLAVRWSTDPVSHYTKINTKEIEESFEQIPCTFIYYSE